MRYIGSLLQTFIDVSAFQSVAVWKARKDSAAPPKTRPRRERLATTLATAFFLFLAGSGWARAQTATVNWTDVHQVIDGFGASNAFADANMSSSNQGFFFGRGSGQLGLSILRVMVPDDNGVCTSVSSACAGPALGDMQSVVANGGRVYASPWTPPAAYKTNGYRECTAGSGNGALSTSSYGAYATWLANFVKSVQAQAGVTLYALSIQNEPDQCLGYGSALWTAGNIDAFIANNLGPTFAADGLSTLIFAPEGGHYYSTTSLGSACAEDSSCSQYVGGFNWHDYDARLNGTNTVASTPYPSGWAQGKKYWQTEVSCLPDGSGPSFCQTGFHTDMTDGLHWAAVIDQRIAVDSANAWLYWWLIDHNRNDDESLESIDGAIAQRAYVLGQYSKFVRPGYYRVDATHLPQSGVSVSAYKDKGTNTLVIIATNYTGSDISQTFDVTNAPSFSKVTPTITAPSSNLAAQSNVSVSGNSFTYTLPAKSITTFVGSSSTPPAAPSSLTAKVLQ